jgi:hypothetical protein
MDFSPLCIALVEDTADCFERMYDIGCLHFAGDIAKHDIFADESDYFATVKPNVNVSRLVVVGIDCDRELSNPRYLRHIRRLTQDLGFVKNREAATMQFSTLIATPHNRTHNRYRRDRLEPWVLTLTSIAQLSEEFKPDAGPRIKALFKNYEDLQMRDKARPAASNESYSGRCSWLLV